MAENVGHEAKVSIGTALASYTEISGATAIGLDRSRDMLETTHFKDTTGSKTRVAGLKDAKFSISGNLDFSDSAQSQIRSRYDDGASAFVEVMWDGSTSQHGEFLVATYNEKADVGGLVTFSADLEASPISGATGVWQ